jgi:uracil-DNA glycosylase
MSNINIEESWKNLLADEFEQSYFQSMSTYLRNQIAAGKTIYPPNSLIFNAFNTTPVADVKVVILGQDPYHNTGQAMGYSFSVPQGVRIPPSLRNIYKEMVTDIDFVIPDHGDLTKWAGQGVLMLNAMLTVEAHDAGSHRNIGWQKFTDSVLRKLSEERESLIYMLWGGFAKKKKHLIDADKHLILEAAHPSPLARGAYFGSKHFSQANAYLKANGLAEIDWQI